MRVFRSALVVLFLPLLALTALAVFPSVGLAQVKTQDADQQLESSEVARIVDRVIASEQQYNKNLRGYSPRIETYAQYVRTDPELGDVPNNDGYFLGRLKFGKKAQEVSFVPDAGFSKLRHDLSLLAGPLLPAHLLLDEFALVPLTLDTPNFNRQHYIFDPVRWQYLGDVRCLAIDVRPRRHAGTGAFQGRIWVEDHGYNIVRLNGTRVNPRHFEAYIHFECWRENLQPGVWLPVYIYSEESRHLSVTGLHYKAETRLWGYDLTTSHREGEWTKILVDAPAPVRDSSERASDLSPVESQRQFETEAEENVLERLEKARLIAPRGPVDKVLETVVNNLVVTNHLDGLPPIHCRVMLTSPLESFSLRYTIVLSRGLIDVLPDEPSLAVILAHELAHIALGHKLDSGYAFDDRLQMTDEQLLDSLDLARSPEEEAAADAKAVEFLNNSPYKDKLANAGLFLKAASEAAPHVPHLFGSHLGNRMLGGKATIRMAALMTNAPALRPKNVDQLAALPLGSRVQVNAWDGSVVFSTRKAVPLADATEKMPFRVTPIFPHLIRYEELHTVNVAARTQAR